MTNSKLKISKERVQSHEKIRSINVVETKKVKERKTSENSMKEQLMNESINLESKKNLGITKLNKKKTSEFSKPMGHNQDKPKKLDNIKKTSDKPLHLRSLSRTPSPFLKLYEFGDKSKFNLRTKNVKRVYKDNRAVKVVSVKKSSTESSDSDSDEESNIANERLRMKVTRVRSRKPASSTSDSSSSDDSGSTIINSQKSKLSKRKYPGKESASESDDLSKIAKKRRLSKAILQKKVLHTADSMDKTKGKEISQKELRKQQSPLRTKVLIKTDPSEDVITIKSHNKDVSSSSSSTEPELKSKREKIKLLRARKSRIDIEKSKVKKSADTSDEDTDQEAKKKRKKDVKPKAASSLSSSNSETDGKKAKKLHKKHKKHSKKHKKHKKHKKIKDKKDLKSSESEPEDVLAESSVNNDDLEKKLRERALKSMKKQSCSNSD